MNRFFRLKEYFTEKYVNKITLIMCHIPYKLSYTFHPYQ